MVCLSGQNKAYFDRKCRKNDVILRAKLATFKLRPEFAEQKLYAQTLKRSAGYHMNFGKLSQVGNSRGHKKLDPISKNDSFHKLFAGLFPIKVPSFFNRGQNFYDVFHQQNA